MRWSLFLVVIHCLHIAVHADDFPKPVNTQSDKDVLTDPKTALAQMRVPDGFRVSLFASEPDVQQPIALATDERGRLWVAENYTYAESKTNFAKDHRDRIVILEDTDHDGRFDKRTVFWDQADKLTSIEIGFGGVWALCAPYLLFIPDGNHDDVPDTKPLVVLDGWNDGAVRHNIVNGLRWGPDGWLYGRHGILATSLVGRPGASDSQRMRINCGMWRYHPIRKEVQAIAHGTTNPWGHDHDDYGQLFMINTVIGHLWHVVPGSHFRRMYGSDFNPHLYQLLEQTADHFHWDTGEQWHEIRKIGVSPTTDKAGGGHAHSGLMVYLGDNWPDEYRGSVLTVNLHGRRLNRDRLERSGAGFVAKHADDFLTAGDPWFRGIDLIGGPDGGVFVADWSDVGECHENDGVHRTSGRIYKITYRTPRKLEPFDLAKRSDAELVELQLHRNDWWVRQSRRILQERSANQPLSKLAIDDLRAIYNGHPDPTRRLRAMWTLYSIGQTNEAWLLEQFAQRNEHLRLWAVKLLTDGPAEPSPHVAGQLAALAEREKSGLVQLYLASALQTLSNANRWPIAEALLKQTQFADDPVLPLLIWYGIEPAVPRDPARAVALAEVSRSPLVTQFIARRIVSELESQPAGAAKLVASLAKSESEPYRLAVLRGMNEALRGWRKAAAPAGWTNVSAALDKSAHDGIRSLSRQLSVVFGDGRAADEMLKLATNGGADVPARHAALRTLVQSRSADLLPLLQKLVGDREMVVEAIRSLANYDHVDTPKLILAQFERLSPEGKAEAINTLVSRPTYAQSLLQAMSESRVPRKELSAYHARQIRGFGDEKLNRQLAEVWGEVRDTSADKQKLIADLKRSLTSDTLAKAHLGQGRLLFNKTCANCHVLYGQGKPVGPDLTGSNRRNLDYLLENVVDPSASVAADFRMTTLVLNNGRVVNGVIVEKTDRTFAVQMPTEKILLDRTEIETQKPSNLSLMPDGLLGPLSPDAVRDLLAYLMSSEQASLPAESE